jgi:hypothetical protein
MDSFLSKFIAYFSSRKFTFFTSDFNAIQVERASLFTRLCVGAAGGLAFGALGSLASGERANATNDKLKSYLTEFAEYGEVVGIYLKYGQPIIVIVVDGEKLNDEEILGRFIHLHQTTTKMRDFSFSLGVLGSRMPARSLTFTVFKSHSRAIHFKETISSRCKKYSLFNKAWVLPFTVDLERKRVFKWSGLPMTEFKEDLVLSM